MLLTNFVWCRTEANLELLRAHANNHIDRQIKTKEKRKTQSAPNKRPRINRIELPLILLATDKSLWNTLHRTQAQNYKHFHSIQFEKLYSHAQSICTQRRLSELCVVCRPSLKTQQIFWQLVFFAAFVFYALFSSFVCTSWGCCFFLLVLNVEIRFFCLYSVWSTVLCDCVRHSFAN